MTARFYLFASMAVGLLTPQMLAAQTPREQPPSHAPIRGPALPHPAQTRAPVLLSRPATPQLHTNQNAKIKQGGQLLQHRGRLAWKQGHWRHELRRGRFGWWWDTGGFAYFYPAASSAPPDYVSEIEEPTEEAEQDSPQVAAGPLPSAPAKPPQAVFYRPGDFKPVPYNTLLECQHAYEQAGNAGVCVLK